MTVGAIGASGLSVQAASRRDRAGTAGVSESRALVPVAAPAPTERPVLTLRRPFAPFLAQLIATEGNAPQTRARRRAEPQEALAAYAAAGRSFDSPARD